MAKEKMTPFALKICKECKYRFNCPLCHITRHHCERRLKESPNIDYKTVDSIEYAVNKTSRDRYNNGMIRPCTCAMTIDGYHVFNINIFLNAYKKGELWPQE